MKIDEFLAKHPWDDTFELLCREPPRTEDLPVDVAVGLIQQHRESQVGTLVPLMLSQVVEARPDVDKSSKRDQVGGRRLRDPRRTARLFIDHAVRSGKNLRRFDIGQLKALSPDDAALGRLLRWLSIAGDASMASRGDLAVEWRQVTKKRADFGRVLSPIVAPPQNDRRVRLTRGLSAQLMAFLELSDAPGSRRLDELDRVTHWTSALVREGAERISELRAES